MKLFYLPFACSRAPHIIAREAGISIELVPVDPVSHSLPDGTDFLTVNPRGYVPVLELDDGERLTEASVILQVLADMAPDKQLLPAAGTRERVRAQVWLAFLSTELHKAFGPLFQPNTSQEVKVASLTKIGRRLPELEARLADNPYVLGSEFSAVDAYAFTIASWLLPLGIDMDPYPNIASYLDRIAQRAAVRAATRAERGLDAS
ncbi:glutathione transferase GstA [Ensifer sp. ENS05]|uniref:glutathione transferase GstA n=1 Tax=Ensifer sp. ENS05 TaxID=2769277 RepID=UPI00177CABA9|nr:glutathione transferase GstA [Ensifer sp. ENS05]MBD9597378.1 glutathione transferase GstA [Ensifer sp. ENS05]